MDLEVGIAGHIFSVFVIDTAEVVSSIIRCGQLEGVSVEISIETDVGEDDHRWNKEDGAPEICPLSILELDKAILFNLRLLLLDVEVGVDPLVLFRGTRIFSFFKWFILNI